MKIFNKEQPLEKLHAFFGGVIFSVCLILIAVAVIVALDKSIPNEKPESIKLESPISIQRYEIADTMSFQDSVLNLLFELRVEHPYIVYSQFKEESGHWSSTIWRENNNMCGMKMPRRRATTALGINKGHAVFSTWRDCVIDYALWQMAYMRGLTEEQYIEKLASSYAENERYEKNIRIHKRITERNGQ